VRANQGFPGGGEEVTITYEINIVICLTKGDEMSAIILNAFEFVKRVFASITTDRVTSSDHVPTVFISA
jgi:hypothetical protein